MPAVAGRLFRAAIACCHRRPLEWIALAAMACGRAWIQKRNFRGSHGGLDAGRYRLVAMSSICVGSFIAESA